MIRTLNPLAETILPKKPQVDDDAGFGVLQTDRGGLPLVSLDVAARLAGLTAQVTVRQTFRNALDEPLEATYIFPLPDRAAVTSFRMRVGDRIVDGELKERGQARIDYQKAIESGHRAAIAEEERSGTFHLRVGNIPPKEEVSVELTLVGPLPVSAGEATFRFPLVVAPRYVPGIALDGPSVGPGWASDTDQAPDASRVTPPVLLPGFPNPVRLSLAVELDPAGLDAGADDWTGRIQSSLHSVITDEGPPWTIRLQAGERLNRDFILRFPVAAGAVQTTLLASPPADGPGTLALTIVPPAVTADKPPRPRDVVVVLDRSGSMGGWKMVAARRAVGRMIDTLLEQDRFAVLAFDHGIERPPSAEKGLSEATDRARWRAMEWLGTIDARGGTEMGPALESAARCLSAGGSGRERILVLVTDGQVAGEDAVIKALTKAAGSAVPRIYTLGIDRAVNAGFLRRLADLGGGACDLVESEDRLDEAMDHIHCAIGAPALVQLRLEAVGGTLVTDSLAPSRLPDLFADRPVTIFGRFEGDVASLRLDIKGLDASGNPWTHQAIARQQPADTLRSLWGRARVRELEDRYAAGNAGAPDALARQIVETSLAARVLSRFTAYVAVDRSEVVNQGGRQEHVIQPVEPADGWDMLAGAAPDLLMDSMVCASLAPSVRAKRRSIMPFGGRTLSKSLPSAPEPRTVEDVVAEIRKLLKKAADKRRLRLSSRRAQLESLVQLLEELATLVGGQRHPEARDVEAALQDARDLLAEYTSGNKDALSADRLNPLFEKIDQALDGLDRPAGFEPERDRFWT